MKAPGGAPVVKKVGERKPRKREFTFAERMLAIPRRQGIVKKAIEKRKRLLPELRPKISEFEGKPVMEFDPTRTPDKRIRKGTITSYENNVPIRHDTYEKTALLKDLKGLQGAKRGIRKSEKEKTTIDAWWSKLNKDTSEGMEMMLLEAGPSIFGKGSEVVMATEHGDIKEATDLIVIYRNAAGEVEDMLALDVTFAASDASHKKKSARTMSGVDTRHLQGVKYVRVPRRNAAGVHEEVNGELQYDYLRAGNTPRAVLPLGILSTLVLLDRWGNDEEASMAYTAKRGGVLDSIKRQLKAQGDMLEETRADSPGKNTNGLQQVLDRMSLRISEAILETPNLGNKGDRAIYAANRQLSKSALREAIQAARTDAARRKKKLEEIKTPEPITFSTIFTLVEEGKMTITDPRLIAAQAAGVVGVYTTTEYVASWTGRDGSDEPKEVHVLYDPNDSRAQKIEVPKEDIVPIEPPRLMDASLFQVNQAPLPTQSLTEVEEVAALTQQLQDLTGLIDRLEREEEDHQIRALQTQIAELDAVLSRAGV